MRPLTVIVTVLASTSAVALGGYWLGQARPARGPVVPAAPASAAATDESDDGAKVAETMAQLNRRLAALEIKQVVAKPTAAEAAVPQRGPQQPMDLAALKQKELERAALIDAALKTEARDNVWAPSTEGQLQTAVASAVKEAGAQFSVKTVKCLTSICEMVLSASTPEQLRGTDAALAPRITGMGSLDIAPPETAADGSATVTYRLFRQGYPRPDQDT